MANRKSPLTPSQRLANYMAKQAEWSKEHTKTLSLRYNLEFDKDILAKLDSAPNKADYIRQLILKDIGENK